MHQATQAGRGTKQRDIAGRVPHQAHSASMGELHTHSPAHTPHQSCTVQGTRQDKMGAGAVAGIQVAAGAHRPGLLELVAGSYQRASYQASYQRWRWYPVRYPPKVAARSKKVAPHGAGHSRLENRKTPDCWASMRPLVPRPHRGPDASPLNAGARVARSRQEVADSVGVKGVAVLAL